MLRLHSFLSIRLSDAKDGIATVSRFRRSLWHRSRPFPRQLLQRLLLVVLHYPSLLEIRDL